MSESGIELKLEDGMRIAHWFISDFSLAGSCIVAGSIRRLKKIVHDVDIVLTSDMVSNRMRGQMMDCPAVEIKKWGEKLAAITYRHSPIDLYFSTPATFYTLLLIRTGSTKNNIRLASIAKRRGWKLHASGDGEFNENGERIAGDSEQSIYEALAVPWQELWEQG